MNLLTMHNELEMIDEAMANFIADVVVSKSKKQKIRRNMECRRKLEEKWEERKLRRETSEYEFEFMH
ncbi:MULTISPECIES: PA3496 family putative envelope integrity protein [unclassified Cellvibrio]|jgi:hypothetical protein|uniref:PA3496 family putative envelope integrity protein n=1 Tax=unclassified Cellvibrio TaxID=2624793 RepID=UPI0012472DBD|nr:MULTISPECIES: hypothetical protein [unclassified Cellvibrio]QEY12997.1 hypothetical protein D0B88_12480 [Cellvibrio sp. KY-YJ-3]UUA73748.1 hypothetical protein NNX04_04720 [Cellvibrio sp. QJXJ]